MTTNTTQADRPVRFPGAGLQPHQVFWAETGEVACACCPLPYPGTDTWNRDRWQEITPEEAQEAARLGQPLACDHCGKPASTVVRP